MQYLYRMNFWAENKSIFIFQTIFSTDITAAFDAGKKNISDENAAGRANAIAELRVKKVDK